MSLRDAESNVHSDLIAAQDGRQRGLEIQLRLKTRAAMKIWKKNLTRNFLSKILFGMVANLARYCPVQTSELSACDEPESQLKEMHCSSDFKVFPV